MVCLQKLSGPSSPDSEVRSWAPLGARRGVADRVRFAPFQVRSTSRGVRARSRSRGPGPFDAGRPCAGRRTPRCGARGAGGAARPLMRTAVIRVDMHNETYSAVSVELYGCDDAAARQRLGTMLSRARARLRKSLLSCAPETPAAFRRGRRSGLASEKRRMLSPHPVGEFAGWLAARSQLGGARSFFRNPSKKPGSRTTVGMRPASCGQARRERRSSSQGGRRWIHGSKAMSVST
jgi:hypothetical protein